MNPISDPIPLAEPNPTWGMSATDERLYAYLSGHVTTETDILTAYWALAEDAELPAAARYLIRLIAEDEERHHRMLREIIAALREELDWTPDPSAVPRLPYPPVSSPALAEATTRLLAAERADRRQLRVLRRELRPFRDTTVWGLLIEVMDYDTAKHVRILTFLRDHIVRPGGQRGLVPLPRPRRRQPAHENT